MLMSVLITIFNAKPHLQAVMKAYMRVLKNLHDMVFQYLINLPQFHHIFFTFQYALMVIVPIWAAAQNTRLLLKI